MFMNKFQTIVILGVIMCLLYSPFLFANGPDILWTRTYGGPDFDCGHSVQQTSDGGYIIAGYTGSFGAGGPIDIYLIKTDSLGDTLWTKTYGGTEWDDTFSVQQTSDGGYIIAGYTFSFGPATPDGANIYLIKMDAYGDTLWTKVYGGGMAPWGAIDDYAYSVQQTPDGGYVIAGATDKDGYGHAFDVYLIKTDALGDTLWTKTYGGSNADWGYSVQKTFDDGYIVAGFTQSFSTGGGTGTDDKDVYLIKTDALGDTLWTKTYGWIENEEAYSVQQTFDGGYIITGYTCSFGAGPADGDIYVIKTDALGDTLWTKVYGGTAWDFGKSVQQTSDGGYIVAGRIKSIGENHFDVCLIKIDAFGNTLWIENYGGTGWDEGFSVQQTSDGGYIITGITDSFGPGYGAVYLIKTEPDPVVCINNTPVPTTYSLSQNYPNPFNPTTKIYYQLKEPGKVVLNIYNVRGQLVKKLIDGYQVSGRYSVVWDGKNENGKEIGSGIYLYKLQSKSFGDMRKMIFLK